MKRICVFCGSSAGSSPIYREAAVQLGVALAERGLGLVYGGARVGLMGVLADAAIEAGAEVIGVIPEAIRSRELAHLGLDQLHVVDSMHQRKAKMAELSDGFIALPGGFGTLEEILEVLTWAQLGIHRKPCGLLDVDGYWQPLVQMADRATAEGFVRPSHREIVLVDTDPRRLLVRFATFEPLSTPKWLDLDHS